MKRTRFSLKAAAKRVFLSWLDFLFPPICALCKALDRNLLCADCQEWLSPPDPMVRCTHCFVEMEWSASLCSQCAHAPELRAPRAFVFDESPVENGWKTVLLQEDDGALSELAASLLVLQWGRLGWPFPDRIAVVPAWGRTRQLRSIAENGAAMLGKPAIREFGLKWVSLFEWRLQRIRDDPLEEEILLLIDFDGESKWLAQALSELWPANPKEVYILSLFAEKRRNW